MKNQEFPKKLTPEEVNQRAKNLEQKDQRTERAIEENDSTLSFDANEEIKNKAQIDEDTKNKIDEIRNSLGISPADEVPPLIEMEEGVTNKLDQEKESLNESLILKNIKLIENEMRALADKTIADGKKTFKFTSKEDEEKYKKLQKLLLSPFSELNKELDILNKNPRINDVIAKNQEKENSEETKLFAKNLKDVIDSISSDSKMMLNTLYERQQLGLTPIQNNDHFRMMESSIRNLRNFDAKIDLESVTEITTNIEKLGLMFNDFRVQRTSQIKEKTENLEKLASGARIFSNSLQNNYRRLPIEMDDKKMEAKSKELRLAMEKLSQQSQNLYAFAVKMRENSRY